MSGQLPRWLALREGLDHSSRSRPLARSLVERLPAATTLRIVDLASGTGSNIRFLSRELPQPQEWLAVDRDAALLRNVPAGVATWRAELGPLDDLAIFSGRQLVTASALLDLVSDAWLATLAGQCRIARAAVLFALTYDGRSACDPVDPEDELVLRLFNQHQRQNDKGFGRAAGPDAVECAARRFADAGYEVRRERSDWNVPPDARELQRLLVEGWAQAASEIAPERSAAIEQWLTRRLEHVDNGRSRIVVGHEDLAGWLR